MRYPVAGALPLSAGGSQDRVTSLFPGGGGEVAGRSRPAVAQHRTRGRAGQGLLVAAAVGEGHSDLDGPALVGGYELVGRAGRILHIRIGCSVTGYPLVGERLAAQTVGVGDAGDVRRQRLAHLRRAADGRRAGCRSCWMPFQAQPSPSPSPRPGRTRCGRSPGTRTRRPVPRSHRYSRYRRCRCLPPGCGGPWAAHGNAGDRCRPRRRGGARCGSR